MKPSFFSLRTLVLGALGLALAACQDQPGPTAIPEGARYATTTINGVQLLNTPPSQRLTPAGIATAVIGPEGGFVEVDGGRLTVPAGALAAPVLITEQGKEAPQYRYKFGPNGLQFAASAMLAIQVNPAQLGVDPARVKVAGANDLGTDWTVIGGQYDAALGAVVVPIQHFSQYSLCVD